MVSIPELWLPIVVAAVLVFVVSSLVHMVLGYHKSDYRQLSREAEVMDALRAASVTPGQYSFPYCASMKEMGTPEAKARFEKGPVGLVTVMPSGAPAMGKFLGLWFGYCLLVSVFVACIASRTLAPGTPYLQVFHIAGAVAFMAYGVSQLVGPIWMGQRWSATLKNVFDGLLYALVTAGAFGWLWPR
jgi:hypothetical protein